MNYRRKSLSSRRLGFTLLEVLLVIAILGVIAALVVPNLLGRQQQANVKATKLSIKGFEDAVQFYAVDHDGIYPEGDSETILTMMMSTEDEQTGAPRAPYIDDIPLDAWKGPLMYEYPATGNKQTLGGKPAIWSMGPDRQDGTQDDINNWDQQQNL